MELWKKRTNKANCYFELVSFLIIMFAFSANGWCRPEYKSKAKPGVTHTSCKPKPQCNIVESYKLTTKMKQDVIDKHNEIRRKFAKGEIPNFPKAANMIEVTWNEELGEVAQDHADRCEMKHDKGSERFTTQHNSVGQNLASSSTTATKVNLDLPADVENQFFNNELKHVQPSDVDKFAFSSKKGHLTQIIFAETSEVGAGATSYKNGKWTAILATFLYAPAGNIPGSKLYVKGEPCSQCPEGAKCNDGLCLLKGRSSSVKDGGSGGQGDSDGQGGSGNSETLSTAAIIAIAAVIILLGILLLCCSRKCAANKNQEEEAAVETEEEEEETS